MVFNIGCADRKLVDRPSCNVRIAIVGESMQAKGSYTIKIARLKKRNVAELFVATVFLVPASMEVIAEISTDNKGKATIVIDEQIDHVQVFGSESWSLATVFSPPALCPPGIVRIRIDENEG